VNLEVRERAWVGNFRTEKEWPLARTQYRKLFLDAGRSAMSAEPVAIESEVRYEPCNDGQAVFDYVFPEDTELTGHMKLRLWAETDIADDMDLFVAIEKCDTAGNFVPFVFYAVHENGPVGLGWLRASHRELDPARTTPQQPIHPHTREQRLTPGVPIPLEIEIWPSSTLFRKGERCAFGSRVTIFIPILPGGRPPCATRTYATGARISCAPAANMTRTCWSQ